MSFLSNVYIIKTLSTDKALTLQESQVYRDISEMDIYSDTYFTACFGEGAYACMDELQDTEALADAVARFYELFNAYEDANLCELHNNVITINFSYPMNLSRIFFGWRIALTLNSINVNKNGMVMSFSG